MMERLYSKMTHMRWEDRNMNNKYKLQFIVSEEEFNQFEELRKTRYSSTSKQHLLLTMFQIWMNKHAG